MANKNQQNQQGQQSQQPKDKNSFLPILFANLAANLFELVADPELKAKSGEVRRLGQEHKASFVLFESALDVFIETRAGFSPATKILAVQILDHLLDVIGRLPADADFTAKIRALEEGGRAALAFVKTKIGGGASPAKPKSREAAMVGAKIEDLREIMEWMSKLSTASSTEYAEAVKLTGRIETTAGWTRLAEMKAEMRLPYLRMTYDRPLTFMENVMATLRGDKVPEVDAIEERIKKAGRDLDALGDRHKQAAANKRRQFS